MTPVSNASVSISGDRLSCSLSFSCIAFRYVEYIYLEIELLMRKGLLDLEAPLGLYFFWLRCKIYIRARLSSSLPSI